MTKTGQADVYDFLGGRAGASAVVVVCGAACVAHGLLKAVEGAVWEAHVPSCALRDGMAGPEAGESRESDGAGAHTRFALTAKRDAPGGDDQSVLIATHAGLVVDCTTTTGEEMLCIFPLHAEICVERCRSDRS